MTSSFLPSAFLDGSPAPLAMVLPCPTQGPFELYARVASSHSPSFLLESGNSLQSAGRYSFFATDPYQVLTDRGDDWTLRSINGRTACGRRAFDHLGALFTGSRIVRPYDVPPFFGGAVGYFSYDLVRQFEQLPLLATDSLTWPDLEFAFFDLVGAIDHATGLLHLIFCPPLERFLGEPREKLYREGCDRLAALSARLSDNKRIQAQDDFNGPLVFTPDQTPAAYIDRVRRCQDYIAAGDIYQANLSHRFTVASRLGNTRHDLSSDLHLYRRLRAVNPSPFSGLLRFEDVSLISSSPERLVRLAARQADTRPIAGTRPRGRTVADDQRLAAELRVNEKERAEHLMLVDLERNDLGRVCQYGSVHVDEFMALERYSHVHHLVSNVTGTLRDDVTGFDLLRAVFPGGTITGVPKIRCMEIIDELEPVRRGPYTGSMGYISWSGDLDFNILIRTLLMRNGTGHLQVGAGIVADSDPMREYEETLHKAQAFLSALS